MNTSIQTLLCSELLKIMDVIFNLIKWVSIQKCEFQPVHVSVVIFGMKHGFNVMGDHFKFIYGSLVVKLNWA